MTLDEKATPVGSPVTTTPETLPSPPSPDPPPNGGTVAWLHVAGGFSLFFNTWGILNASIWYQVPNAELQGPPNSDNLGVYQTYYESGALFKATSSQISWIGSTAAFLLLFTGLFAGPVYDRGYLRALLLFGSFLIVLGHMMLSISEKYWQAVITQGGLIGVGTGCLFVPCIAVLPQYFSSKLGLAMGIAVSGSALGGIIYPIALYELIGTIGFRWAVRVLGFFALATLAVPILVLRLRVKPQKVRAVLDPTAFTDVGYMTFIIATFLNYTGLFVLIFYLSYYAEHTHITSESLAFYLVPIFNAGSLFGRTIPNIIADKSGPLNLLAPSAVITGMLMLCMMAVTSKAGMVIMALISGFMSGALIGLPPLCLVGLAKDKSKLGTRMGMGYAIIAFGVLASGPSGGGILGQGAKLDWDGLWTFGGVLTSLSGALYVSIRVAIYGFKLNIKA